MARREEILFAERIRNDLKTETLVHDFQQLVRELLAELPAAAAHRLRHQPNFIQLMGQQAPLQITRIVREREPGDPTSSGYDFSDQTLTRLIEAGYRMAIRAIDGPPVPAGSER
jgi:NTE family protein